MMVSMVQEVQILALMGAVHGELILATLRHIMVVQQVHGVAVLQLLTALHLMDSQRLMAGIEQPMCIETSARIMS
jgi:hypothetical protein